MSELQEEKEMEDYNAKIAAKIAACERQLYEAMLSEDMSKLQAEYENDVPLDSERTVNENIKALSIDRDSLIVGNCYLYVRGPNFSVVDKVKIEYHEIYKSKMVRFRKGYFPNRLVNINSRVIFIDIEYAYYFDEVVDNIS